MGEGVEDQCGEDGWVLYTEETEDSGANMTASLTPTAGESEIAVEE
jgi:hypothetical protein